MGTLDPDRWPAVSAHLDEALDLPEAQRAGWLRALGERDPDMARAVETLLAEHGALARARFLEDGPSSSTPALAGQTVGAYTVTAPIGEGGMGSVWLAVRSDGRFERRAAVKFLRAPLAGRGEARFRHEGRILARLTHPHIAHLLDAGVSGAGQPYLVLEHVDGEPIDAYCTRHALDVPARLRLFLDVVAAVAHAHAHLVVHRDLKPSNVLVTAAGEVKLLDFGIAKLLEDEGEGALALTREGGAALTPAYAAPEQLTGAPVSTATDVYALGVLLFVLLTGRHPAGVDLPPPADLVRAIAELPAPRPSDVVADRRLRRTLRGDLDTIVLTALRKAPADRYASATALADDLRRYLRREPIAARPESVPYRVARFVSRHRLPVAAAVVAVAALAATAVVANRQRLVAQERFDQVRELANKLFEIDVSVRELPNASRTRQLIVDTSLDYLRRLAAGAAGDPVLALDLGTAYMRVARVQGVPISANLGQVDQAEQNLQEADRLIGSVLAADPGHRLATLRSAQIAHDRMILAGMRRPADQAIVFARRAAEQLDRYTATGPIDPAEAQQVVIAYMNVGNRFVVENRFDEGVRLTRRTIEIARAANLQSHVGSAQMVLASALREQGELEQALDAIREAVRILQPGPADTRGRQNSYSMALSRQGDILGAEPGVSLGRHDEAIAALEEAYRIAATIAAADPADAFSRERVTFAGLFLADILRATGSPRALAMYDETLRWLGEVQNARARREEARALARSTYALRQVGRAAEVRPRLDEAVRRLEQLKLYPADRLEVGSEPDDVLRAIADDQAARGDVAAAVEGYRRLLALVLASNPAPDASLSDAYGLSRLYAALAALERRAGRDGEAAALDARRDALWRPWQDRPGARAFVARHLAATPPPARAGNGRQ